MSDPKSSQNLIYQCSNFSSHSQSLGLLQEQDVSGKVVTSRRLFADQELIIGRDRNRCQYVLDDPVISNKHLRIYSVFYDSDKPKDVAPLVYAEDLSRNGTFWNGSLIGKGNGGFLLSHGDTLRLSPRKLFVYYQMNVPSGDDHIFDVVQEHEMNHFRKDYIITDRVLGAGAYGRVHMGIERSQRTQLACKVVDLRKLQCPSRTISGHWERPAPAEDIDGRLQLVKVRSWAQKQEQGNRVEERLKTYYREAEILASLSHPNIIGLEKVYLTDNSIYIFQDIVTAGDLFSYIELRNGRLLDVEVAVIVRQILVALEFLHEQKIVHRDLKPENILMTTLASGCRVVLTDFGCARRLDHRRRRMLTCTGTYEYTAPEVPDEKSSNATTGGYTDAVDLWSLGCVTVVLLTGGYPFFEPGSAEYSERLASKCNLEPLESSETWQNVGVRPKDFVRRLLVLDEGQRMTAKESLTHEWFTNDVHRTEFEELYRRSIRHWRPRLRKEPVIELIQTDSLQSLSFLQGSGSSNQKRHRRGPQPIDPPYKPFPRRLHNQVFFPKRKISLSINTIPEDVKTAIEGSWKFDKSQFIGLSVEDDVLPTPHALDGGKGSDKSATAELQENYFLAQPTSLQSQAKKSRFQPFRSKLSLTSTDLTKTTKGNGDEAEARKANSYYAKPEEEEFAPVQKAYSPTFWRNNAETTNPTSTSKAKVLLSNNSVQPRYLKALSDSNSRVDLPHRLCRNAGILHGSRYFLKQDALEPIRQPGPPVIGADEEGYLIDRHILHETSNSPSLIGQTITDRLPRDIPKPAPDPMILILEPENGAECSHSSRGALGTFVGNENATNNVARPERVPPLMSPTCAVSGISGICSSNMKKRRSQSIFDYEDHSSGSRPGHGKKAKTKPENVKRQDKQSSINTAFSQTKANLQGARSMSMEVEKILGQTDRTEPLFLPRV